MTQIYDKSVLYSDIPMHIPVEVNLHGERLNSVAVANTLLLQSLFWSLSVTADLCATVSWAVV